MYSNIVITHFMIIDASEINKKQFFTCFTYILQFWHLNFISTR
jgi:hypothetical protein